jgi:hypothetical protein
MAAMDDDRKRLVPPSSPHLAVTSPAITPIVGLPSLPASSGKVWGSRTTIMEADARFVRAHGEYLEARTEQTQQMKMLVDARIGLALKIAELAILPELAKHEYEKGRRDRAYDVAMQELTHQTAEVNARINFVRAQQHLASLNPDPEPRPSAPPPPPAPAGLDPREVEAVLQRFPDIKPESIEPIVMMLRGILAEKKA